MVGVSPDESFLSLPKFPRDRFVIEMPTGSSGGPCVARTWDRQLERQVACKCELDPATFNTMTDAELDAAGLSESMRAQLERAMAVSRRYSLVREARLLSLVDHPNVMPILDVGRLDDRLAALVMPYLGGGTAAERDFAGPWQRVLEVAMQIGRGLAAIHDAGILHRDIKPSNILFDSEGWPRVADLGLACRTSDRENMADIVGTKAYMPPGVLEHGHQDVRDDLYAYCMVVFEMVYGRRPFATDADRDRGRVVKASRGGGTPRELYRILARGLAPDPDKRWPSMKALLLRMERVRGSARRPWPWAAAGLGLAASFAVGMLMSSRPAQADACEEVMSELDLIWNDEIRAELRGAFGTRKAGDGMQEMANRWLAVRAQECEIAKAAKFEIAPTPCSAVVRDRFQATVQAFRTPHLRAGSSFATVIAELPAPEHCIDHPEDAEWGYGGFLELRNIDVEVEALVRMGDLELARARQADYMELAHEQGAEYGVARAIFWRGEIRRLDGELDEAEADFELAYEEAWALGLGVFGAEVQMKLVAVAGERGEIGVVDAHAFAARAVLAEFRPDRVAELLQVHGLALASGPQEVRERGVGLLLRAVEQREAALQRYGGTRELLSQAHENYARGLLAVGRASEALKYLELALTVHEEEFGHGTWRTRGILLQEFLVFVDLGQLNSAEVAEGRILKLDWDGQNWARYTEDALWLAKNYADAAETRRAIKVLRAGRAIAVKHDLSNSIVRFDLALEEVANR
ncbi:Serine/threonine-protein kinase PrkC [Enhygromyxa salina]|uniref:Serine/threonine-protein kinase PrkC n=1 Tax=Enhygromyxa salina TaxID=215803 RepID=A0A2S9XQ96_9BACT|nr:serine/threonine-protein kinase [Enhygromyxa salina]PRP95033.1 Serine/threonine-protein kinase PrkC [Enhygromyxa salina]